MREREIAQVGAIRFEPRTSWSETRRVPNQWTKSHKSLSWRHLLVFGPLSVRQVWTSFRAQEGNTHSRTGRRSLLQGSWRKRGMVILRNLPFILGLPRSEILWLGRTVPGFNSTPALS